jgi:hypothetical protein
MLHEVIPSSLHLYFKISFRCFLNFPPAFTTNNIHPICCSFAPPKGMYRLKKPFIIVDKHFSLTVLIFIRDVRYHSHSHNVVNPIQ